MLIQHCSPTLAGIKTGNMFSCSYTNKDDLRKKLRDFNRRLRDKGLCLVPIKYRDGRALIYVFRPAHLLRDLCNNDAQSILRAYGYFCDCPGRCVRTLIDRLKDTDEFPHEIGLFLGYPPEDVSGFINEREGNGRHCKCVGHWKVYGDEANAKRIFDEYDKCTNSYCANWLNGKSIESLTVAVE